MPLRASRICGCGYRIASGAACPCERRRKAATDKQRLTARERGYDSTWEKERAAFLKTRPVCVRCSKPSAVVDHIVPHRGDKKLFWSRSNWQALCRPCHSSWKQAAEKREAARA